MVHFVLTGADRVENAKKTEALAYTAKGEYNFGSSMWQGYRGKTGEMGSAIAQRYRWERAALGSIVYKIDTKLSYRDNWCI